MLLAMLVATGEPGAPDVSPVWRSLEDPTLLLSPPFPGHTQALEHATPMGLCAQDTVNRKERPEPCRALAQLPSLSLRPSPSSPLSCPELRGSCGLGLRRACIAVTSASMCHLWQPEDFLATESAKGHHEEAWDHCISRSQALPHPYPKLPR